MKGKKLSLLFFMSLIMIQAAHAQAFSIPEQFSTFPEILFFVAIPAIATFALIFGFLSKTSILISPRTNAIISLIITLSLLYFGILSYVVNILFSFDYYLPIFAFILLFFVGASFYMRREGERSYRKYRLQAKKIRREKLPKLISQREKAIARIEAELARLQAIEDELEEKYAASKDESTRKRLDKVRRKRARLANKRDRLIEEKKQLNKMYKEAVT